MISFSFSTLHLADRAIDRVVHWSNFYYPPRDTFFLEVLGRSMMILKGLASDLQIGQYSTCLRIFITNIRVVVIIVI